MGALVAVLVLVVYPITEIILAVWVASLIGWGPTIALLAVGFAVGILIMRWAGMSAAASLRSAARTGALPGGDVGAHALTFLGGLLIMVPGFLTDLIGLLLVLPPTRSLVRRTVGRALGRRVRAAGFTVIETTQADGTRVSRMYEGDVVQGEVVQRHDEPPGGTASPEGSSPGQDVERPRRGGRDGADPGRAEEA